MTKELWINLPVADVNKSKAFFSKIGFSINEQHSNGDTSACILVGTKKIAVMLFKEDQLKQFIQHEIADTRKGNEVIFSFDAESKEEVDDMAKKVSDAGGIIFSHPAEMQGWMYGFAFIDPDGHRWNALYMDMSKMKKQ